MLCKVAQHGVCVLSWAFLAVYHGYLRDRDFCTLSFVYLEKAYDNEENSLGNNGHRISDVLRNID